MGEIIQAIRRVWGRLGAPLLPWTKAMIVMAVLIVTVDQMLRYRNDCIAGGYPEGYLVDLKIYTEASLGNPEWARSVKTMENEPTVGWLYPDWTANAFLPLASIPWGLASNMWVAVMLSVYAYLLLRILELSYGWIWALASIKAASLAVASGNIIPLVAIGFFSPAGILLAACFKLWPLGALAIFAIKDYRAYRALPLRG